MSSNKNLVSTNSAKKKALYIKGLSSSKDIKIVTMSPYYSNIKFQMPGNNNLENFGVLEGYNIINLCFNGEPCKIDIPDIVVNCMADVDVLRERLEYLKLTNTEILKKNPNCKIINKPEGILKTGRDSISQLFQGLKGIIVPKVIKIQPKTRKELVENIKKSGLKLPVLVRKAGIHGGYNLVKLDSFLEPQLEQLDIFATDGADMYVTEFYSCQSPDGFYRKARIVMVNGKPYVRHLIISDEWNIHSRSREDVMNKNPKLIEEEKNFLKNGTKNFSADIIAGLGKIYHELELDVFGVDAGIMPNGEILVFEINAAMEFIAPNQQMADYVIENLQTIKNAFLDFAHG